MPQHNSLALLKPAIALLIVLAIGVAGFSVLRLENLTSLPDSFNLDLSAHWDIDSSLIHFEQIADIPIERANVGAIAVGLEDRIFVAGEDAVEVFLPDGSLERTITTGGSPQCLAVGSAEHVAPGRVYVGAGDRIQLYTPNGQPDGIWESFDEGAVLTSIGLTEEDIFVADAANRIVLRLSVDGEILERIGDPEAGKGARGFVIPSGYFDLVASSNGLVHIVNPGARRVETYAFTGELENVWGKAGSNVPGFFGCCNPSHLATLPDGRFITSEKGIPRVKVYSSQGEFESVVAGPKQLDVSQSALGDSRSQHDMIVFDVACDSRGRILVLDPKNKTVRIFVSRERESDIVTEVSTVPEEH